MGTETIDFKVFHIFSPFKLVKLNNPLMGTETGFSAFFTTFLVAGLLN